MDYESSHSSSTTKYAEEFMKSQHNITIFSILVGTGHDKGEVNY